jgi:hypothetical protein
VEDPWKAARARWRGEFCRAGDLYRLQADPGRARRCYRKGDCWPELARLYRDRGRWARAAALYRRAGDLVEAAETWDQAGRPELAEGLREEAGITRIDSVPLEPMPEPEPPELEP